MNLIVYNKADLIYIIFYKQYRRITVLSAKTLERVSISYRRGYYDGYDQKQPQNKSVQKTDNGIPMKPFSDHDYFEGYRAGLNDYYWENKEKIGTSRVIFMEKYFA